jgi:hypothetical protein
MSDFIYGLKKLTFGGTVNATTGIYSAGNVVGYISEEGMSAGGDAPSTTKIRAAQANNAVVAVLFTTPGSKQFTFSLIQLKGDSFKDVFGGTLDSTTGVYSAPVAEAIQEGAAMIECSSGHVIIIKKASLVGNLANAINLTQTLAISCTLEILTPDDNSAPYLVYPPGKYPPATG